MKKEAPPHVDCSQFRQKRQWFTLDPAQQKKGIQIFNTDGGFSVMAEIYKNRENLFCPNIYPVSDLAMKTGKQNRRVAFPCSMIPGLIVILQEAFEEYTKNMSHTRVIDMKEASIAKTIAVESDLEATARKIGI